MVMAMDMDIGMDINIDMDTGRDMDTYMDLYRIILPHPRECRHKEKIKSALRYTFQFFK